MVLPLRERRRQMLRDEILQAARILIGEKGHVLMSMDDLAAQVGISKPTLYSFFATKDELVIEAAVSMMVEVIEFIETVPETQSPLKRLSLLLQTILERQIDTETMQPRPWRSETFQFLCEQEQAHTVIQRVDEVIVSLAQQAIEQGEIESSYDVALVVRIFSTLIHTLNIGYTTSAGLPETTTLAKKVAQVFEQGVCSLQYQAFQVPRT